MFPFRLLLPTTGALQSWQNTVCFQHEDTKVQTAITLELHISKSPAPAEQIIFRVPSTLCKHVCMCRLSTGNRTFEATVTEPQTHADTHPGFVSHQHTLKGWLKLLQGYLEGLHPAPRPGTSLTSHAIIFTICTPLFQTPFVKACEVLLDLQ